MDVFLNGGLGNIDSLEYPPHLNPIASVPDSNFEGWLILFLEHNTNCSTSGLHIETWKFKVSIGMSVQLFLPVGN